MSLPTLDAVISHVRKVAHEGSTKVASAPAPPEFTIDVARDLHKAAAQIRNLPEGNTVTYDDVLSFGRSLVSS